MNCSKCGKCCINLTVTNLDYRRLFNKAPPRDAPVILVKGPCPFLQNGLCSIYDHRPISCITYPIVGGLSAGFGKGKNMLGLDTRCVQHLGVSKKDINIAKELAKAQEKDVKASCEFLIKTEGRSKMVMYNTMYLQDRLEEFRDNNAGTPLDPIIPLNHFRPVEDVHKPLFGRRARKRKT